MLGSSTVEANFSFTFGTYFTSLVNSGSAVRSWTPLKRGIEIYLYVFFEHLVPLTSFFWYVLDYVRISELVAAAGNRTRDTNNLPFLDVESQMFLYTQLTAPVSAS